jgi:nucleoside-diphosphate-sugar epimerase
VSVNEVISTLEKVTGIKSKKEYDKTREQVNYLIGNPLKAMNVLGHKPEIGLEDGLTRMVDRMER